MISLWDGDFMREKGEIRWSKLRKEIKKRTENTIRSLPAMDVGYCQV
ncbi:MAG: hypothetical protein KAG99_02435 [Bacteroidales bacterium]|nr:hypothetical protein [Bacteroidales bacterium]